MTWKVGFHPEFKEEFDKMSDEVRVEILAQAGLLEQIGPHLGRPSVDHLKGSSFANMKELRFNAEGNPWRVAFAFDEKRAAILLVGGNKNGVAKRVFYRRLITEADKRFAQYLKLGKK